MANGLYTTFCEVTGLARWCMVDRMPSGNNLTPGKLLILKLSGKFYLQCTLESGKVSKAVKLAPNVIGKLLCRDGQFSCHVTDEGGITFILKAVDDSNLEFFVKCLTTINSGGIPDGQTKVMVEKSPQQNQNSSTPTSKLNILRRPRNKSKTSVPVSQEKNRDLIEIEDHCDKENDGCSIGLKTPDKGRNVNSSNTFHSFGTPHKTTPLNKRPLEEVPQKRSAPKVKFFYGSGVQRSSSKKQPTKRSSLDFSSRALEPASPRVLSHSLSPSAVTSKGFLNLGNTCYMNAILQSLLGLVPFVQELANKDILQHVKRSSLYRCMYNLHCCKDEVASSDKKQSALKRFRNAIFSSEMTKRFSGHLQNDAHEFMNICLDQMKEEVQTALGGGNLKQKKDVQTKVCPITRNFEGCLKKHIICTGCKDLVTKDELFNHLSLNIPVASGPVPLNCGFDTLLRTFFKEEKVERKCDKCECNIAIQSLQIQSLPRVMILHVLRSEYRKSDGTQEKNSDGIRVYRYLDIGMFCSSDVKGPTPFSLENIDSSSTKQDNETPSGDQDDFVISKSRRRLNMSIAQESSSSSRPSTGNRSPDWVNHTPRIASSLDTSPYNSRRLHEMNDKEQLELATQESLKLLRVKQLEDDNALAMYQHQMIADLSSKDQIVPSTNENMKDRGDCKGTSEETRDTEGDEKSRRTEIMVDSNENDVNDVSSPGITRSVRKRTSSKNDGVKEQSKTEKDAVTVEDFEETPMKKRKIGEKEGSATKKNKDFSSFMSEYEEDNDLERALELSLEQTDEQSQVEEAIKRSLEDDAINAELLNLPESVFEEHPVLSTSEEKDLPSHQYKLASIVRHIGSTTFSGHYISDVADLKTAQWTRFNDLTAEKVSEFNVRYRKESDGYIYFYLHKNCVEEISCKST